MRPGDPHQPELIAGRVRIVGKIDRPMTRLVSPPVSRNVTAVTSADTPPVNRRASISSAPGAILPANV
jgi:hypothetical protein